MSPSIQEQHSKVESFSVNDAKLGSIDFYGIRDVNLDTENNKVSFATGYFQFDIPESFDSLPLTIQMPARNKYGDTGLMRVILNSVTFAAINPVVMRGGGYKTAMHWVYNFEIINHYPDFKTLDSITNLMTNITAPFDAANYVKTPRGKIEYIFDNQVIHTYPIH